MIGEGELEPLLPARCHELGIEGRVWFCWSGTREQGCFVVQRPHTHVAANPTVADGNQTGSPNLPKDAMAGRVWNPAMNACPRPSALRTKP